MVSTQTLLQYSRLSAFASGGFLYSLWLVLTIYYVYIKKTSKGLANKIIYLAIILFTSSASHWIFGFVSNLLFFSTTSSTDYNFTALALSILYQINLLISFLSSYAFVFCQLHISFAGILSMYILLITDQVY